MVVLVVAVCGCDGGGGRTKAGNNHINSRFVSRWVDDEACRRFNGKGRDEGIMLGVTIPLRLGLREKNIGTVDILVTSLTRRGMEGRGGSWSEQFVRLRTCWRGSASVISLLRGRSWQQGAGNQLSALSLSNDTNE
jgi:hypothetical protein